MSVDDEEEFPVSGDRTTGPCMDDDYYVFLNVERSASHDEITAAYRRLSRCYHPDKHASNDDDRQNAEIMFSRLKTVYQILSEPHLRQVYDQFGAEAAHKASHCQIVDPQCSPSELLDQYERRARRAALERIQSRSNPRGTVTLHVNATDIFTPYRPDDYGLQDDMTVLSLPRLEVTGMTFTQSVEAPLSEQYSAQLSGQLVSRNGTSNGQVSCTGRRVLSDKGWAEVEVGVGSGLLLSSRAYRSINRDMHSIGGAYIYILSNGLGQMGMYGSLSCRLSGKVGGQLTWRVGVPSCVNVQVERNSDTCRLRSSCQLGVPTSFISTSALWKLPGWPFSCRISAKCSTTDLGVEMSVDQRLSSNDNSTDDPVVYPASSLSLTLVASAREGVALRTRLSRLGQHYQVVFAISDELMPLPLFYGCVTPLLLGWLLHVLVLKPHADRQRRLTVERHAASSARRLSERRREAAAARALMVETVERIRRAERERHGLLVVTAFYGAGLDTLSAAFSSTTSLPDLAIDVTVPLQCLVEKSALTLATGAKSALPGFYDPCPLECKWLLVFYMYRGCEHRVLCRDGDSLLLPSSSHKLT